MAEVLSLRFVGYRFPFQRELPATGRRLRGRVDRLIIRAHLRARETGALPNSPRACQRHNARPCFRRRRVTFLTILESFLPSARRSDIIRPFLLFLLFSPIAAGHTIWRLYSSPKCPQSSAPRLCLVCR